MQASKIQQESANRTFPYSEYKKQNLGMLLHGGLKLPLPAIILETLQP